MSPGEFQEALRELGLNGKQAAEMLGYGSASRVSEIVKGKERPGRAVIRLLEAYLAGYRPPDWPV